MVQSRISFGLSVLVIVGVFSLGYLYGSLPQRQADAQMGGLSGIMEQAGKLGGPLGAASELGNDDAIRCQKEVSRRSRRRGRTLLYRLNAASLDY